MPAHAAVPPDGKAEWRARLLAARRTVAGPVREARDSALTARAAALAAEGTGPICAYVPIGAEPGGAGLPEALAATGRDVLLPVVPPERGPLEWARFDGSFARGPLGLREPAGPRLGPAAIADAGLVLVPALAADRSGVRLGRGAGYYDRTLPLTRTSSLVPAPLIVVIVDDDELVDQLPAAPHDWRVGAALLPEAGLVTLGKNS